MVRGKSFGGWETDWPHSTSTGGTKGPASEEIRAPLGLGIRRFLTFIQPVGSACRGLTPVPPRSPPSPARTPRHAVPNNLIDVQDGRRPRRHDLPQQSPALDQRPDPQIKAVQPPDNDFQTVSPWRQALWIWSESSQTAWLTSQGSARLRVDASRSKTRIGLQSLTAGYYIESASLVDHCILMPSHPQPVELAKLKR